MLGSASPIYEIVSGKILLGKQEEFAKLHRDIFMPLVKDIGIEPVLMLVTETGSYGRFINIYRYSSLEEYGKLNNAFMKDKRVADYFEIMLKCIDGSLQVEFSLELFQYLQNQSV
jgi:NIPSNAP